MPRIVDFAPPLGMRRQQRIGGTFAQDDEAGRARHGTVRHNAPPLILIVGVPQAPLEWRDRRAHPDCGSEVTKRKGNRSGFVTQNYPSKASGHTLRQQPKIAFAVCQNQRA
jgi:hypothetical protein